MYLGLHIKIEEASGWVGGGGGEGGDKWERPSTNKGRGTTISKPA